MPTILVIDDNEGFRVYLKTLLERQGYDVLAIETARLLENLVRDQRIDAVVTDLYMPEVDGLEVVSFFNHYDPQLPVFGVTGYSGADEMTCIKAMNAFGAREVFTKPLDSAKFLSALGRALKHTNSDIQDALIPESEDDDDTLVW